MSDDDSVATESDEGEGCGENAGQIGTFVDLSQRWSAVKSTVSAADLIEKKITGQLSRDGKRRLSGSALNIAAADGDLEAFVNICDTMKLIPDAQPIPQHVLYSILEGDSPEVLDEFIRRSGGGISFLGEDQEEDRAAAEATHKQSKLYLGLTVHGKKRKDLANHGDVHARNDSTEELPLLWLAARNQAKKIIAYLAGDGPLAAYRYYASTSSEERALDLRKRTFDKMLPALLGITPNIRNETTLTAVLVGLLGENGREEKDKLDILKYILSQFPSQAKAYLHSS